MDTLTSDFVRAGTLDELKAKGRLVIHGRHRLILVLYAGGQVFALDNRCRIWAFRSIGQRRRRHPDLPLASCPLRTGERLHLRSLGGRRPTCPVEIREDGEIWVKPEFGDADPVGHWHPRLEDGLAHNLSLVIAKAVHGIWRRASPRRR